MNNINYTEHQLSKECLNKKIRELINNLYECEYTGNLVIDKLYPIGYKVSIPLLCNETPFVIAIEAEGELYLKYLKNALQESALNTIEFRTISDSKQHPDPVKDDIKGNYSKLHRVLQDSVIYTVAN